MKFEKLETFQPITITLESEEDFHDLAYALKAGIGRMEELNSHPDRLERLQKMLEELDNLVLTTCYNT